MLNSPQLIISIQLIKEKFEYALQKSADRSKPTAVFHITEVDRNTPWRHVSSGNHMIQQQRHMPSGKHKLDRYFQITKQHLISRKVN